MPEKNQRYKRKIIPIFETGQTKKVEEAKRIIDPIDEAYEQSVREIEAKDKRIKKGYEA